MTDSPKNTTYETALKDALKDAFQKHLEEFHFPCLQIEMDIRAGRELTPAQTAFKKAAETSRGHCAVFSTSA